MNSKSDDAYFNQRKFVRLSSACSVEFGIVRLQGDLPGLDWHRGITQNVSRGGLCLEVDFLRPSIIQFLKQHNVFLDLKIHMPLAIKPIKAVGEVSWFQIAQEKDAPRHSIGLRFRKITQEDLNRLLSQTETVNSLSRIVIGISVLAAILLVLFLTAFMM